MGYRASAGFTIVEMIVTTVVVGIFVGLLFQGFVAATSQRAEMTRLAAAHDIATSNLKKMTNKASLPAGTACDDINHTSSNQNNLKWNGGAAGSEVTINAESLSDTPLPSSTSQKMYVIYPQGCSVSMPAQVKSVVTYESETVTHVKYIN